MTHAEITRFLEDYRDGVIDEQAATTLAETVRGGGTATNWVMEELALSGWIAQALDELDDESFVRSFLERLHAEREQDAFAERFQERIHAPKKKATSPAETRTRMPRASVWRFFVGRRRAKALLAPEGQARATRRRTKAFIALGVVVVAIALAGTYLKHRSSVTAVFMDPGPGVVLLRDGRRLETTAGMRIRATDTVLVPLKGQAKILYQQSYQFELKSGAVTVFGLDAKRDGRDTDGTGIYLQTGELEATCTAALKSRRIALVTPHATAYPPPTGRFVLSSTATSTRLEVIEGTVRFTRHADGKTIDVPPSSYALATEGLIFRPKQKQ